MPGHDPVLLKTAEKLRLYTAYTFRKLGVRAEIKDQLCTDECYATGEPMSYWYLQIHVTKEDKLLCRIGLSSMGAAVFGPWQIYAPETNVEKILNNVRCIINQGDEILPLPPLTIKQEGEDYC